MSWVAAVLPERKVSEPAFFTFGISERSAGAEALVGGLTGGAEGFPDLFPGCAFLVASQGHMGAGEPVGGGGHAGGRNCQNEVT